MNERDHLTQLLFERYGYTTEAYAVQQADGHYVTWREPLAPQVVDAHIAGEISVAAYILRPDNTCILGALDHDDVVIEASGRMVSQDGLLVLQEARARLRSYGADGVLYRSGRGAHLHVHALTPVPAYQMRLLLALAIEPERWARQQEGERGIEVFPKSEMRGAGLGSNIRVPAGMHRRYGQRFPAHGYAPVEIGYIKAIEAAGWVDVAGVLGGLDRATMDAIRPVERRRHPETAAPRRPGPIGEWNARASTRSVAEKLGAHFYAGGRYARCPRPERHRNGDAHPSFAVFRDGAWRCFAEDAYGSNAFDLVAWWLGYESSTLSGDDARAVLAECLKLVP